MFRRGGFGRPGSCPILERGILDFIRDFCYTAVMTEPSLLAPSEIAAARQNRLEAMRLQEIEGNPLTPAEVRMFEMFEREGWPHDRCRAYILAKAKPLAAE